MKYVPILPEEGDRSVNEIPLGVHVVYEEDDYEELEHLLVFLEQYFEIPEQEAPRKGTKYDLSLLHPYAQLLDDEVSLPFLLSLVTDLEDLECDVVIGFLYPGNGYKRRSKDILTFRAYKKHLDETGKDWPQLREMYQAIEDEFFPLGKKLN